MVPLTITLGGNATVLISWGEVRVVTDPWLGSRIGPWPRLRPPGLRAADLDDLAAVVISHAHPDHLDPATLRALSPRTAVVTPGGAPLRKLRALGMTRVHPLRAWEEWTGAGLRVTATPCVHTRWSLGYVLEAAGRRVYFAGDAAPGTPFAEIAARCGPLDAALIPVGGSSLAVGRLQRHLTPALAARAAAALRPRLAIPIHWGHVACVPAVLDRFRGTAEEFIRTMRERAPQIRVACPEEGVSLTVDASGDVGPGRSLSGTPGP